MKDLEIEVNRIVRDNTEGMNKKEKESWLKNLSEHGCVSGMVSGLIYYRETGKFTDNNREAIMELLAADLEEGLLDGEFIANKIKEGTFDNFLAWYAFEKIALENFEY